MVESYIHPFLPDKFLASHKLLLYYNDLIVDIILTADEEDLSSFAIEAPDMPDLESAELMDWLINNGYEEEALYGSAKHTFFSLLSDFNFYMHESFSCSERGKVTVAYAVSRKPLKDNLLYFCWLLNDYEDFTRIVLHGEPAQMSISKISREKKIEILDKASKTVGFYLDGKALYEILYDRKTDVSLTKIWDKSLHLITDISHYPTEQGNINFVFADDEIWEDYWQYYYTVIPYIMAFAMEVIITIFEKIINASNHDITINKVVRLYKSSVTFDLMHPVIEGILEDDGLNTLLDSLAVTCDNCKNEIKVKEHDFLKKELIDDFLYTCPNCEEVHRLGQYIFFNKT